MASQELNLVYGRGRSASVADFGVSLLVLALWIFFISDTLLSFDNNYSQSVKIVAFSLLALAILIRPIFHRLILMIGPIFAILLINLGRSFYFDAGIEEFMRFLFPVVITIAIYAYRDKLNVLIATLIIVVVTNDVFQIYFYIAYFGGLPLFLPVRIDSGIFLRAQGWLGFFSEFAFINFSAFILYRNFSSGNRATHRAWIYLIFATVSFSFKLMVVAIFYPVSMGRLGARKLMALGGAVLLTVLAIVFGLLDSLLTVADSKVGFYITRGNSARAESYRVMAESLYGGNLLGEGLGSFGGPASVKYGSPLYSKYHFDWYGLGGYLKTTDTFYPHLFVELGLLGGVMWCLFMIYYGQGKDRGRLWWFFVLVLLFDNLFSMSLLSPGYIFSALLVMYAISRDDLVLTSFALKKAKGERIGVGR